MGILFVKDNMGWYNDGKIESLNIHKPITLKAGEWTTVAWSMKSFGIKSDIFEDGVSIQIKTQIKDKSGLTAPYSYCLAMANFDLVDYSEQKFPTLDTTEPVTVVKNGATSTLLSSWKPSYVSFETTTETKYLHNNSQYAIKFNLANTTQKRDMLGSIGSAEDCSLTSWDNVVLTADIYNEYDSDLEIGILFIDTATDGAWYNDGVIPSDVILNPTTLTSQNWTTVAWSLKSFGVTSNIFEDNISIRLLVRIKGKTDFSVAASYSLAITNLDLVDYSAEKFPDVTTYYGTYKDNEVNRGVDIPSNVATITFDYLIVSGETINVVLRRGTDSSNIYGAFAFDANGAKEDYDGITVTKLETGYIRVVINLADITLTTGTPPSKEELNVLHFPRWSGASYYYGNVRFTYNGI